MATQYVDLAESFAAKPFDVKKIFAEFAKPIFNNVFFNNLASLRLNSDFINFNVDKWYQRPTSFCYDIYEESQLYPVILLVNNIKSFLDFVPSNFPKVEDKHIIIAPHRNEIRRLLNYV